MSKLLFVFIFFLALNFIVFSQEQQRPVAMLTSIEGIVFRYKHNSQDKEIAELGMFLNEGDVINVKNGRALIYFIDGNIVILNEGEELELGLTIENSIKTKGIVKRSLLNEDFRSTQKLKKLNIKSSNQVSILSPSGLRAKGVIPIGPSGNIYNTKLRFCWIDSSDTETKSVEKDYVIIISDSDFNEVTRLNIKGYSQQINYVTTDALPINTKSTQQIFYWDIFSKNEEPSKETFFDYNASFKLQSETFIDSIKKVLINLENDFLSNKFDESTYHLLCGLFLKENNFNYEAINEIEKLSILNPRYKYPYEEIAELYFILGKTSAVMVDFYLKKIENF